MYVQVAVCQMLVDLSKRSRKRTVLDNCGVATGKRNRVSRSDFVDLSSSISTFAEFEDGSDSSSLNHSETYSIDKERDALWTEQRDLEAGTKEHGLIPYGVLCACRGVLL